MLELDKIKQDMGSYLEPLREAGLHLDLESKRNKIEEIEKEMESPTFWDDQKTSTDKAKELKSLKDDLDTYTSLTNMYDEIISFIEIAVSENDYDMIPEIKELYDKFVSDYEKLKMKTLLSKEYDKENAILTLHAGAGGTEACDWTLMLYRMYSRWAEKKGFKVSIIDQLDGDEAGLKSITMEIEGENAYGYLKSEKGVHRLVRISPFNANGKRQTSFSSCDVMPDIEKDIDIEIKPDDIRIDTFRSSGAGGQHINKTSSAIRITHFPTGIVVSCQNERSQLQNKEKAFSMLKTKLFLLKEEEHKKKEDEIRGEITENAFGSQIRSYVLQPYTMVKDLRTGDEMSDAKNVLDGNIDKFIMGYLRWLSMGKPKWKGTDID